MVLRRMLDGHHLAIMEACTVDEFRHQVIRFAKNLEFETIGAITVVDHSPSHSDFYAVDNTPLAFQAILHDRDLWRLDPVVQHCK